MWGSLKLLRLFGGRGWDGSGVVLNLGLVLAFLPWFQVFGFSSQALAPQQLRRKPYWCLFFGGDPPKWRVVLLVSLVNTYRNGNLSIYIYINEQEKTGCPPKETWIKSRRQGEPVHLGSHLAARL